MEPDDMLPDDDKGCQDEETCEHDPFLNDGEADGDALASAGMGTDEMYNCYEYETE